MGARYYTCHSRYEGRHPPPGPGPKSRLLATCCCCCKAAMHTGIQKAASALWRMFSPRAPKSHSFSHCNRVASLRMTNYDPYAPPNTMTFYRGGHPLAKVAATLGACGLGGFNCDAAGEQPQLFIRCFRIDVHTALVQPCTIATCCCCCCLWPKWAACLHRTLKVDFYKSV